MTRSGRMGIALSLFTAAMIAASVPAFAHEEHRRQREAALKAQEMRQRAGSLPVQTPQPRSAPATVNAQMAEMTSLPEVDRSKMTFTARLLDWLGRLHPIIVHFPIAFFPAAFFTAIVGRRRPAYAKPVQFLVVAGGVIAPIAAIFGWIDGGFSLAADDWLLSFHRWFGTVIGVGAFALAVWAIRKPEEDQNVGAIVALGAMTAAIVVQGWFGGALTHGFEHLNW